jgi:8-oxo-dGTP pyrophosphatase MutT (NUDIX family)
MPLPSRSQVAESIADSNRRRKRRLRPGTPAGILSGMPKETHADQLAKLAREGKSGTTPVAASTVILVRDASAGLETLMLRKNSKIAFGGMWVFPGGRVDEADRAGLPSDDELAAARRAAAREAEEESALSIAPDSMVPFSHWTPPAITPKRFLTWFFLADAPAGDVVIDQGEIHEHAWMSPAEALRRRDAAEIELAPPTFVSLFELSRWSSVEEALGAVRDRTPERFETRISVQEGSPIALWHGDAGYAAGDAALSGARHRLSMVKSGWRYERTR